jgi:hypothetical protein
MVDFTTEQKLPFTFVVVDGMGRPAAIDGAPSVASSDETVVKVDPLTSSDNITWSGEAVSVLEGDARVVVTADTDTTPEGVSTVMGTLDCHVTLDPRTSQRTVKLTAGTPVDKPV